MINDKVGQAYPRTISTPGTPSTLRILKCQGTSSTNNTPTISSTIIKTNNAITANNLITPGILVL